MKIHKDNFEDLFVNAIKRGVRIRVLFAIYGNRSETDEMVEFSQDQYFALTFFQKLKLKYNCNKYKGSIDAKFIRAGRTPQKFDEEGEMYCYCKNEALIDLSVKEQIELKMDEILKNNKIEIHSSFVGEYVTSLEMNGASITLLKLDDELKPLLENPAHC